MELSRSLLTELSQTLSEACINKIKTSARDAAPIEVLQGSCACSTCTYMGLHMCMLLWLRTPGSAAPIVIKWLPFFQHGVSNASMCFSSMIASALSIL